MISNIWFTCVRKMSVSMALYTAQLNAGVAHESHFYVFTTHDTKDKTTRDTINPFFSVTLYLDRGCAEHL